MGMGEDGWDEVGEGREEADGGEVHHMVHGWIHSHPLHIASQGSMPPHYLTSLPAPIYPSSLYISIYIHRKIIYILYEGTTTSWPDCRVVRG